MELVILNRDTTTLMMKRASAWVGSGYEEGPNRPVVVVQGPKHLKMKCSDRHIRAPLSYMGLPGNSRASGSAQPLSARRT